MFTSSMLSSYHAPNTLICTIADRSELDRTAIHNGGSARDYLPGFARFWRPVMAQRASGCPYVYSSAPSV